MAKVDQREQARNINEQNMLSYGLPLDDFFNSDLTWASNQANNMIQNTYEKRISRASSWTLQSKEKCKISACT